MFYSQKHQLSVGSGLCTDHTYLFNMKQIISILRNEPIYITIRCAGGVHGKNRQFNSKGNACLAMLRHGMDSDNVLESSTRK